jgi:hypothetical protein
VARPVREDCIPVGLRHPGVPPSSIALQDDDYNLEYTGLPIRLALADRALHFVPADLIVRWLGDQPPVSETATEIPARVATGLSRAIIAAPAFSSGMRSAISSPRSSRPSVIIASMAG